MNYRDSREIETRDVKIGDLNPLDKKINVIFKVIEQGEEKGITKRNSHETHRVCDFTVADDTGKITLALWNEDIDSIEVDATYRLSNCFVNVFHDSLRLSKGKYGSLEEDPTVFDTLNEDNDRSSEHHEDPRRRTRERRFSDRSSSYGFDRSSSNRYRDSGRRRQRSSRW